MTEQEMRDSEVPWPKTPEELSAYIASLVEQDHDYGTCVYAMSMAATAAFQYVAGKLGVTGFQASCADLDVLRRTRGLKNGFRIIDYDKILYPQYNSAEHFPTRDDLLADPELRARLAERAGELLAESPTAHPEVLAHWKELAHVR